jgi:SAM-dependent methyltransferase
MLFEAFGSDMAQRAAALGPKSVLEVAAGTGIATGHLRRLLPPDVPIMATDLNEGMLEIARRKLGSLKNLEFRQADAVALPFADSSFDAVVCQFGIMFIPDKLAVAQEAARVLKPGGTYLLSVWDSLEKNDFVRTIATSLKEIFADDPPTFFAGPYGYYHLDTLRALLETAGFHSLEMSILTQKSPTDAARNPAMGYLLGTPFSFDLARYVDVAQDEVIARVTQAIAEAHGEPPVGAKIQAIMIAARVS